MPSYPSGYIPQHKSLATGQGLCPAPSATPRTNFIKASDAGTNKDPHPNPMMKKSGRGR